MEENARDDSREIAALKARCRDEGRLRLRALGLEHRQEASAALRARLREQSCWERAGSVLLYAPRADEPDIFPLVTEALAKGKRVCLPRFNPGRQAYEACEVVEPARELSPGRYGIPEPGVGCPVFALNRLDFVLVPGICFDECGYRLGRGRGYYDRLLGPVPGMKCGVAFEEQLVSCLPRERHDVKLDCILTPRRWIVAGRVSVA